MLISADIIRSFLVISIIVMAWLGAFYLSRRSLSLPAYLAWGLLILLVPLLGPFLVIAARPGKPRG